jgi:hypothetical protein
MCLPVSVVYVWKYMCVVGSVWYLVAVSFALLVL